MGSDGACAHPVCRSAACLIKLASTGAAGVSRARHAGRPMTAALDSCAAPINFD